MEFLKGIWQKFRAQNDKLQRTVICLLIGFMLGGLTCRSWRKAVVEETPSFGWIDDPERVKSVLATFKNPYFGDAGKKLIQSDKDEDALLYKIYEQVTGHAWKPHDQDGVGSCVGNGYAGSVTLLSAVECFFGDQQDCKPISSASIYALSREVGNYLGNQDGSTGVDAAKAITTLGCISCDEAGDNNQDGAINGKFCKDWGRRGLPKDKKELARSHVVRTASLVRTPEEVRAALVNGYVVPICSSVGFEGKGGFKRDADGFCYPGGTWAHCMFVGAYRADKKAFLVFQSWGPNMPPGPKSLDQPDGTFWITWDAMARIVKAGDSYALSAFEGYKPRSIPFFIQTPAKRDREFALAF